MERMINESKQLEKLYNGKITRLEYVLQSDEMKHEYEEYCKEKELQENESSAQQFMDYLLNQEVESHTDYLD